MAKLLPFVAPVTSRWRRPVDEARVLPFLTKAEIFAKRWCEYRQWLHSQRLQNKSAYSHQSESQAPRLTDGSRRVPTQFGPVVPGPGL